MVIADIGSLPKAVRKGVKKVKKKLDKDKKKRQREALERLGAQPRGERRQKSLGESLVLDTTTPLQNLIRKRKAKGPTFE